MVKFSNKLMPKKSAKSGTAANFGPKIGTVPLKVGQLKGMWYALDALAR